MPTRKNKNITQIVTRVNKSSADFVNRLKDPNRISIPDWEDSRYVATHKLGVGTDDNGQVFIYPSVQNINGKLVDFTAPKFGKWDAMDSAIEHGDTVHVDSIQDGLNFTENYKRYYPKGKTFKLGGRRKARLGLEDETPTQEEYIAQQIADKRKAALDKSRNRTSVRVPMVLNSQSEEEWNKNINALIESNEIALSVAMANKNYKLAKSKQEELERYLEEKDKGYPKLAPGANCMYNAGDCYGLNIPGNQTFATKHKELGFKKAAKGSMEPGDLVQDVKGGFPNHAMIYDSKDAEGNLLFNYARGLGDTNITSDYVRQGKYPLPIEDYDVYKYVGTPADSTQWINEYKQRYGNGMRCGGRRKAQLGLDIREGGIAIPIANNMFYIDGRKHAAGGVAIGPNNKNGVEVEGGEVVEMIDSKHPSVGRQFKAGGQQQTMRVFSSVPFLRGASPAELVLGGANPDAVFKAQEEFKDRNRINDDGTTYEMGGEGKAKSKRSRPVTGVLPYGYTIRNLYAVENPYRKGIKGNVAKMYDSRTLGAGVDVISGHPELYKKAKSGKITKKQADETAVIHLRKDDNAIRSNYADIYGKAAADTLSYGPRFLVAQARYQQGNVRKAWSPIHKAMAKGDAKALKKAILQVTPKDHAYRRQWIEGFKVYKTGGIYIKPSKRGTFTAAATKHGMGVQEFASKVLANKEDYSPAMVKKANFARNASRWKKEYGGDENVLPEVVVTGKKPKTFFEKLDDYANISEKALAIPNLALSGASLISPNPITIGGAYLTSASGALLDLYQGGRALYKGDWFDAGKNAIDLGLSLIGLRALRNANKLNELDKALDASGATREYVRKSVGRGKGKRKATFTKEKNEAITQEAIGYSSIPAGTAFSMLDTNRNKKEYGGNMLYTINGNVKNGLMASRPKAQYGKIDRKNKDVKVGPDGLIYKRAADGKWYTDGTKHITSRPIVKNSREDLILANDEAGYVWPNSDGTFLLIETIVPKQAEVISRKFDKPKRTHVSGYAYEDEEKETKKIGSLTYEKNEDGQWVPASKQSITTTRDSGKPKNLGITRIGVNHPSDNYNYHPLTGEKVNNDGIVETSEPSIKGTTKVSSKSSSTARGRGTKVSTHNDAAKTTTKGADVKYSTPLKEKKESLYMTGIKNNSITPLRAGMEKIKSPSSTGGGTQSKDERLIPQFKPINTGDWIGLGSNLAGHIASYFINNNLLDKYPMPTKPALFQSAKLKTTHNINPKLATSHETEQMNLAEVGRNTSSSSTSIARKQRIMNEARDARNKLYGEKENIETQLINLDRRNRQDLFNRNIAAVNDWLDKTYIAKTNKLLEKQKNMMSLINGIPGAVNHALGIIETRRNANNAYKAIAAANPNVDGRLLGIGDYYVGEKTKKKYDKFGNLIG